MARPNKCATLARSASEGRNRENLPIAGPRLRFGLVLPGVVGCRFIALSHMSYNPQFDNLKTILVAIGVVTLLLCIVYLLSRS
jgi:hypothetical protein